MRQITNAVLMVRPASFRKNEQTATNNFFQKEISNFSSQEILAKVHKEFDDFVTLLRTNGIRVIVVQDTLKPDTPDAVFPNNWFTTHANGTVALYPMFAENRREERNESVFDAIEEEGYLINDILDYTEAENEGLYLEGTGSIILDRVNKKAYCALSERADIDLFIEFCEDFDYHPIVFNAFQTVNNKRKLIYHTNVMMALGETFAILCLSTIDDKKEKKEVVRQLKESNKEIIDITENQMHQFAGNMLQLKGANNQSFLVMSEAAYLSLTNSQLNKINAHCSILNTPLSTIETLGGGSARCMLAEVFLPK